MHHETKNIEINQSIIYIFSRISYRQSLQEVIMGVDFTKALCLTRRIIGKRVIKLWRALRSKRVMGLEAERPVHMMELVVRSLLVRGGGDVVWR